MEGEQPILLVVHDDDGTWQFMPGASVEIDDGVALHLVHIVERHPYIHEIGDLPPGWAAERDTTSDPWRRIPLSELDR